MLKEISVCKRVENKQGCVCIRPASRPWTFCDIQRKKTKQTGLWKFKMDVKQWTNMACSFWVWKHGWVEDHYSRYIITCLPLRGFLTFTSGLIRLGSGSHFWCINAWESIYTSLEFPNIYCFKNPLQTSSVDFRVCFSAWFDYFSINQILHYLAIVQLYNGYLLCTAYISRWENVLLYNDRFRSTHTCWLKPRVNSTGISCCMPESWA